MLEQCGLDGLHQALYEYMLTRQPASESELADVVDSEGWEMTLAEALQHLQLLGLVARIPADPPLWAVVAPETALEALLLAREQELANARLRAAELMTRFHGSRDRRDPMDSIDVIYGQLAVLDMFEQMQRSARLEVCATDAPPYVTSLPATSHPVNELELELLARGVIYRVLYHPAGLDRLGRLADLQASIAAGEQARVVDFPIKLLMADRSRALLPLQHQPPRFVSALRIAESTLIEALHELFEMHWERAIPLKVRGGQTRMERSTGPTAAEQDLLPLLVAGLSDPAIARQLDLTERTVRRHVRQMMVKLNATTRFQAGYQAVQLGWLGDTNNGVSGADN
ncbi:LuxR C-terminal-related transcriptional regulator [Micromonospora sp. NPDC005087]|uniref:LuxR C-terminal-related transcriptional regulator n=1 Tax=Micromonospora sp. NPDC005087 TaxID=3364225 RepID=UPI0036A594E0